MLLIQSRHDLLKRMKQSLKTISLNVLSKNDSYQLERSLLKDYKTAKEEHGDASRSKRHTDMNQSMMSDLSELSSASSTQSQ